MNPTQNTAHTNRRTQNAQMAQETVNLLPGLLAKIPNSRPDGFLYQQTKQRTLNPKYCPNLPQTPIRVYDCDSFDRAIKLGQSPPQNGTRDTKPVLAQNLASHKRPGGGWMTGAAAQEESLCYRSSLSLTLKREFYPIPETAFNERTEPNALPVVSVISSAALRHPQLDATRKYKFPADRETMKRKMRSLLRVAAREQHRRLVLGAFGCGAFKNPNKEVAEMWAEVFAEPEFSGGWWESVIFAVMKDVGGGKTGNGNFESFKARLDGMMV